ncbi:integrase, catalytic region, zinc finger, CCHC-type containing protein [Tanacetum coccineum]|uniref:Integrase, catalytic region, zinc finger, CCHC-type containing protein n=1 Tax=Tanacetum coccineum TaxID=301880 RepID=A0ABQ4XZZ5_9ASTR
MYKSSHTAKQITWHATGKCTEPGKMQHPVDGRAWKTFDTKYPDFAKEPRNVRLGLAADGFNLFGNLSQSYSMWSVILTTYNLPPWLCMKESSFMLMLVIPGPKSLGKDIDVYLRPLINDVKDLWEKPGVETIDVATGQKFNMRAVILWTINDFPARRSLSRWSRQEDGDPPREFGRDQIQAQLARLPKRVKGKHPSYGGVKIKRNIRQRHVDKDPGVSASSELFSLSCGPTPTPISVNSCVVNGVRFVVHSRDERRTTQNSNICLPSRKDGEMYYGQLQEILEFLYLLFKVVLFRDDHDVIHFDNSSDLTLSTSLNDLDFATLHIDDQSTDFDAPPDIIDVGEEDDIIDDEDALPHDLADSDDEDLVNVDDDDLIVVYSSEEED